MSVKETLQILNEKEGFKLLYDIMIERSYDEIKELYKNRQINGAAAYRLLSYDDSKKIYEKIKNKHEAFHNTFYNSDVNILTALEIDTLLMQYEHQIKNIVSSEEDVIIKKKENYETVYNDLQKILTFFEKNNLENSEKNYRVILYNIDNYGVGNRETSLKLLEKLKSEYSKYFNGYDEDTIYKFYFVYLYDAIKQKINKSKFYIALFELMLKIKNQKNMYNKYVEYDNDTFRKRLLALYIKYN